ncbi:MAG: hypothetical protein A2283_18995 [Lentisphaerae bacterium RIFOXYA12_FULL_48_11]|nr:MAG: hypothetical protein A2283_18995 [Lentisphaerae bacterium RIFOXYA12_FULL_48_11]
MQVPTTAPVKLTAQHSPLGGRLVAGLVGGFILAVLAANISSVLFGDVTAKEQSVTVTAVSVIIFFGLWATSVIFAIKANRAAKVWRRLFISNACLSFALPLAGFITAGKAVHHFAVKGHELEAATMAGAGGIAAILLGILGFFLGAIFLTVGLLVGRDKQKTG